MRRIAGGISFKWEGEMKLQIRFGMYSLLFVFLLLLSVAAGAQQESVSIPLHGSVSAYEAARESALQGTVVEYDPASAFAPFGAHVLLQTSAGAVDAHLGIRSRLDCASTDANVPLSMNVPAISIGAGDNGGGAHTSQEWFHPEGREFGLKRILLTACLLLRDLA